MGVRWKAGWWAWQSTPVKYWGRLSTLVRCDEWAMAGVPFLRCYHKRGYPVGAGGQCLPSYHIRLMPGGLLFFFFLFLLISRLAPHTLSVPRLPPG